MDNENGKTLVRLGEWQKAVDEKLDRIQSTIDAAWAPEGYCTRSRNKLGGLAVMVRIQWILISAIILAIITQALK